MRIESYSEKWLPDVTCLVERFHAEAVGEYEGMLDKAQILKTIQSADHDNAFLLIINEKAEGILYGTTFMSMTSNKNIFQEIMWYVNQPFRQYGIRLLRDVEKLLKSKGVNTMIMAVLENSKTEKLKRFYGRMGFKKMEEHWIKET